MADGCERETLARGHGCSVETCECGTVHLTVGAATVRLAKEDFATVAAVIAKAAGRLAPTLPSRLGPFLEG